MLNGGIKFDCPIAWRRIWRFRRDRRLHATPGRRRRPIFVIEL